MSRPIIYNKLFNSHLKQRFLETIEDEDTRNTYSSKLKRAYDVEEKLNKDIYEFSRNEFDELLRTYSNRSYQSVYLNVSCLSLYVDFCIKEGFVPNRINCLDGFRETEVLWQYVDESAMEKNIISRKQLSDIQGRLRNARDVVVLELLFLGVEPKEMEDLKIEDCFLSDKLIKLSKSKNKARVINNLSESTLNIINDAIEQKFYYDNNGRSGGNRQGIPLPDTKYLIKTAKHKAGRLPKNTVTRIVAQQIKKYTEEPYLASKNIIMSGFFDLLQRVEFNFKLDICNEPTIFRALIKYWFGTVNDSSLHIKNELYEHYKKFNGFVLEESDRTIRDEELVLSLLNLQNTSSFKENRTTYNVIYEPIDERMKLEFLEDYKDLKNETEKVIIDRVKRYQKIVSNLKMKYGHKCQICGCNYSFPKKNGTGYCEAYHIQTLANGGSQEEENVIILCANHHRMLHYGRNVKIGERKNEYMDIYVDGLLLSVSF